MFASGASLALLALAVSLDGFGVGASYGMRGIRIPMPSILIIAVCSGAVVWLAMTAGGWLTDLLPPAVARSAGAVLLIAVGLWALIQLRRGTDGGRACEAEAEEPARRDAGTATVARIELRRLGLVICILRAPQAADTDRSGTISASEAVPLGVALSLDALGAGFGAAMVGFPALPASLLIAAASGAFLLAGLKFGRTFASRFAGAKAVSVLPGLILIATGIARLIE
jgi:putative sporulation protein YtaF